MKRWWRLTSLAPVLALGVVAIVLGAGQRRNQPAVSAAAGVGTTAAHAAAAAEAAPAMPPVPGSPSAPLAATPAAPTAPRALPVSLAPSRATARDSRAVSVTPADAAASTTTASVTVRPSLASPLDRFTFTLTGFAANERVVISFQPPEEALEILGVPDDAATVVDGDGAGRFELVPVNQWGPTAPGDYTVRFRGEVSGAEQALTISFVCGC